MNRKAKIYLLLFCLVSILTAHNFALASIPYQQYHPATVSEVSFGISDFVNFFSQTIFGKIRADFCENYRSSISSGEWKTGEFRTNLGEKVCLTLNTKQSYQDTSVVKDSSVESAAQVATSTSASSTKNIVVKKNTTPKVDTVNTTQPKKTVQNPAPLLSNVSSDNAQISQTQIIYWTNFERTKATLPTLSENSILDEVALARVNDMFEKGYFEHVSPTGDNVAKMSDRLGYKSVHIGENIAMGNFQSARNLLDAWMASEGHRENILNNNYAEIGVAAKEAMYKGSLVWISAQVFGKPAPYCPLPDPSRKTEIDTDYATSNTMQAQAQNLLSEINSMNPPSNQPLYDSKVAEYKNIEDAMNALISTTKQLITNYNNDISVYNNCIKK